ncbi:glycosyltransferase family 4 protein [Corynebacterium aquatimens]|uniref:Glycosyltransferase involved in cell wall biosynthesis n=1 Tax=Corynebacterium aquatimens TaxID=1190508 RepID=A0A931E4A9_9CORY|nr:glycosyltransferase family 4 protein [Corynebacterium aquatimens]MBG6122861.1 glycosyltransferase involved in cell wall biosynthesis [Corynebacterium aquatimens]WJY66804.1 D-inositol 3-phosphate glycosyltransferase [Corynebacterium aquatimens]
MKILLLCWRDSTHPQGGGSERYLERVGEYLAARGHEVIYRTSLHTDASRRSLRDGIRYERAGGKYSVYLRAPFAVWRNRPDVIVDTQNGVPFFAKLYTRRPVVALTHHCHRSQWPVAGPWIGRLGWFLESRVAPRVYPHYVTVSEASAADLAELGAGATIIANGLDPVPDFPVLPDDGRIHLVTLSRLVPHKQIEHAIDVVRSLADTADVVLDIIGSGWWEDQLRSYASDLGERVVFHGHVSDSLKHALLSRAYAQLMPSLKEGWGIAVLEAAQHSVPTIGYRAAGGLRDSINDQVTGLLVDSRTELIDATQALIRDRHLRDRLGAAAQERAAQYSWDETGRAFEAYLSDLSA